MSATIYNYRFFCTTENLFVSVYKTETPTTCPNNNTHTIDSNSITVINKIDNSIITINEETTPTGGFFRTNGWNFNAPANTISNYTITFPYPINVLAVYVNNINGQNTGDFIDCYISPDTTIGVLTANVANNTATFNVNSTVTANSFLGYDFLINHVYIGEIINIDKVNNTITTSLSTTTTYTAGQTVQIQLRRIKDYYIGSNDIYSMGLSKIGASYVPTNTITKICYNNTSLNTDKILNFVVEYLF